MLLMRVTIIRLETFIINTFIIMITDQQPHHDDHIDDQEVAAGQYLGTGGLTMVGQLVPMLQVLITIIIIIVIIIAIIIIIKPRVLVTRQ